MPSDDSFDTAWEAIDDDDLFKGIIRDWARNRQQRIAAERAADRMRGENLTFQLKYGRPMPTTPPGPAREEESPESSEGQAATETSDDSPPPETPPQNEETPEQEEERMKATIPKPDADAVREASATDIVSKPPKKKKEAKPEPKPKAKAKTTATKKPKKQKVEIPAPKSDAVQANQDAIAGFARGRKPKSKTESTGELYDPEIVPGHFVMLYRDGFGVNVLGPKDFDRGGTKEMDKAVNRAMKENKTYQQALADLLPKEREDPQDGLDTHGMSAQEAGYHFAQPDDMIDIAAEGNVKTRGKAFERRTATEPDLPNITPMTDSGLITELLDLAEEGDEAARIHLYNSMGDLEDHFPSAAERYDDIFGKQFVLKDPFANPFHNPNYLETVKVRRNVSEPMSPIIKSQPPQEESKPDIGFDVVEGDDLSLLPASLFAKNAPGGDDMSLLPSGWKSE